MGEKPVRGESGGRGKKREVKRQAKKEVRVSKRSLGRKKEVKEGVKHGQDQYAWPCYYATQSEGWPRLYIREEAWETPPPLWSVGQIKVV